MNRALTIVGFVLACVAAVFWLRALSANSRDYIELPLSANPRDFVEGKRHTQRDFLLMSDRRGVVFDVFVRQLPPERAPGPPWSEETQRWLKPRAERTAAAYGRFFAFEKGIEHRHGQYLNDAIYFYGTDYYFAVPHLLLIVLGALPALWTMWHHLRHRTGSASPPSLSRRKA